MSWRSSAIECRTQSRLIRFSSSGSKRRASRSWIVSTPGSYRRAVAKAFERSGDGGWQQLDPHQAGRLRQAVLHVQPARSVEDDPAREGELAIAGAARSE